MGQGDTEKFKDQNYEKLRKHHRELGVPWTDPTFPASEASIGLTKARKLPRKIEWKRPGVRNFRYILTILCLVFET